MAALTPDPASDKEKDIKRLYSLRLKRQIVLALAMLGIGVWMWVARETKTVLGLSIPVAPLITMVLMAAGIVLTFINWRCPSCRRYLGHSLRHTHCPLCGVPFV